MFAIKAEGLGKEYRLYSQPWDSLKEWLIRKPCHETINALSGIDFELLPGETLGIVGNNGAGKSTLLKLLAGTIPASTGSYQTQGRISAILELGSGFHPEFSGRENAKMGCALMGLTAAESLTALPAIIAFSELGHFIDKPVKTYSSGMYVRLAFSVVTAIDPDILIVDEALSVGDQHFQRKSLSRMREFRESGKTIIFCTHNLYQIKELCAKALWLEQGRMVEFGAAFDVVDNYQDAMRQQDVACEIERKQSTHTPASEDHIVNVALLGGQKGEGYFVTGTEMVVQVEAALASVAAEDVQIGVVIMRNDHIHCYGVSTQIDQVPLKPMGNGRVSINLVLESLPLLSGKYYLCVYLLGADGIHIYDYREEICPFVVRHKTKEVGVARLAHQWR
ncbi:MAG: ABC transporter ATP-binding protein [Gammaproteobacteria bacterium HGW-Gammaproteobacteria-3]|nr:MAG: ABC transporter ATP-binding protein [Gammaproteobacteria bacterium HGW-Gammaproteobacteria-3]